jgi:hypothetical protein
MGMSALRGTVSCVLVVVFPLSLWAADTPSAMLYSHGTALLNGNTIAKSSAIFSGDLVQTSPDSVANINITGSSVLVLNESLVQYEGSTITLEHGGVAISTSKSLATRAGGVKVSPVASVVTEFEVRDVDGKVQIAARRGDLSISDNTGTTTLAQGQETTRDESQPQAESQTQKGSKKKKKGAEPAAAAAPGTGAYLNSPIAIGIAGGIVLGGTAWVLSHGDDPVSPAKPNP